MEDKASLCIDRKTNIPQITLKNEALEFHFISLLPIFFEPIVFEKNVTGVVLGFI